MVEQAQEFTPSGTGGGVGARARVNPAAPFALTGDVIFAPAIFPERVQVRKQRQKDRKRNFCGGENISDTGSKNRDLHVTGFAAGPSERAALDAVADHGGPLTMSSSAWSGEVQVVEVEYTGPAGFHPPSGSLFWEYTIDLVSTGLDEPEAFEPITEPAEALRAVQEGQENDV